MRVVEPKQAQMMSNVIKIFNKEDVMGGVGVETTLEGPFVKRSKIKGVVKYSKSIMGDMF